MSLGLLHLAYFIFQCVNQHYLLADSKEYLLEAENIRSQFYFYCGNVDAPFNRDLLSKRTPLYPLILAGLQLFFKSFVWVTLTQIGLSFLNVGLLIKALRLYKIEVNYFLLLVFLIFTPSYFIYANLVMSEILFQICITICFVTFLYFLKKRETKYLWIYILSIILAMMAKPAFYLFAYANIALAIFYYWRIKQIQILYLAIIPVAFVLLYSFANQQRSGHFHFSSISKINALNYNSYYFLMKKGGAEQAELQVDAIHDKALKISDYDAQSKFIKSATKDILIDNFFAYGWYHFKGSLLFFLDPGRFDLASFFGVEGKTEDGLLHQKNKSGEGGVFNKLKQQPIMLLLILGLIFFFNLIKLLALFGFAFKKSIPLDVKIIVLGIIAYLAFLTGPLGASRFALPVLMLVLFACLSFWEPLRKTLT